MKWQVQSQLNRKIISDVLVLSRRQDGSSFYMVPETKLMRK